MQQLKAISTKQRAYQKQTKQHRKYCNFHDSECVSTKMEVSTNNLRNSH